jgi:hypothetical protein
MPASSTLASQFTQTFPQVSLTMQCFLSWWGGVAVPQGILTAAFSAGPVSEFAGNTQWSSGEGVMLTSGSFLYIWASGWTSTAHSPVGEEAREVLGSSLSLYTQWWPHSSCYWHCHLRFSLFVYRGYLRFGLLSYQPVILWLVSKS